MVLQNDLPHLSARIGFCFSLIRAFIFEPLVTLRLKAVLSIDFSPKMVKMLIYENS
jgi:hypothetical protein